MADITNELNVIAQGRYGKDVRQAIHDGLDKVNQGSSAADKVDKVNPTTSGTMTHTGDATISGILTAQQALITPSANAAYLSTDTINVNTRGGDVTVIPKLIAQGGIELDELNLSSWLDTLGSDITKNAQAIAELEDRPAGIELEGQDVLTTSAAAKIRAIDVKGKSSQHISKNILVPSLASGSKNGISYTVDNNKITIGGTATAGTALTIGSTDVVQGSVYTLSVNGPASSGLTVVSGYIGTVQMTGNHMTKTSTASASTTATTQLGIASGTTVNGTYTFQVEKGETDTTYDPYTGQPTPANPIPIVDASGVIQAIGGSISYKAKTSGKYFDYNGTIGSSAAYCVVYYPCTKGQRFRIRGLKTYTQSAICEVTSISATSGTVLKKREGQTEFDVTTSAEGYLAISVVESASSSKGEELSTIEVLHADQIDVCGNKFSSFEVIGKFIDAAGNIGTNEYIAYTPAISVTTGEKVEISYVKGYATNDRLHAYDAAGNWVKQIGLISDASAGAGSVVNYTFTVDASTKAIRLSMGKDSDKITIYGADKITLRSLDTVADELIVYPDKTGKIIKRAGTTTIGSLEWRTSSSGTGRFYADIAAGSPYTKPICTSYRYSQTAYEADTISSSKKTSSEDILRVYVGDTRYTSASDFKSGMSDAVILYALTTPTETPLTAAQVKAILALQTYNPETIIETELSLQSVGYTGDTKDYIDSKFTYSTEEILIGSWEGAPLYRRTMYFTSPSVANQDNIYRFDPDENCEPKLFTGTIYSSNGDLLPLNYYWSDSEKVKTEVWDNAVGKFTMNVGSALTNKECKIIIDYIKPYDYTSTASVSTYSDEEDGE